MISSFWEFMQRLVFLYDIFGIWQISLQKDRSDSRSVICAMRLLMIRLEELADARAGAGERLLVGQEHYAEVVGRGQVEARALRDEYLLFVEQVERELHIVLYAELFYVQLGEDVEGGVWLFDGNAGDVAQHLIDEVSLLINPSAGQEEVVAGLRSAQRGLNDALRGDV